ncbi:MAG: GNAT family N-acetyltransferase [Desulfovibrio sp.]|nr:MAG: GNAT family N-acetyltransferase [Desulfovibrio sp.]
MIRIERLATLTPRQFDDLCDLLVDAVESGASVGFLSPISRATASEYWHGVEAAIALDLVLFAAEVEGKVVGSVQLVPCPKENGQHRAEIQKLFVLRGHQGRGMATQLMQAAEQAAASMGRTLLVLDTHEGSLADAMYPGWGWQRAGAIPDYAAGPDGSLHPTVYYYKRIAPETG